MTNVVEIGKQEAQQTDVLMRVRALTESKVVSASQIAKEISVSHATLSQILNGSYKADPSKMIQKLERWLNYREEKAAKPSVNPGFVMTQTAQLITNDLTYAQYSSDIACIYGASGVGKTQALRHYKNSNNNVWMITACPSISSLVSCLHELALELGLNDVPKRAELLGRAIRKRLLGTGGLVIVDEADHLKYEALEELRAIQEYSEVGMVVSGNNKIYTKFTGGSRTEDFARLYTRIAKKRGIKKTKQADVRAIADAWNVNGATERSLMQQISERPGGLRILSKTLKLATMFANGQSISEQVLRKAFAELETNE